ncbi:MAG: hypothetical protein HDR81_05950 [Bacteroides sp.]|nr:hypothetical protein [Bacteroides sp.]MBD5362334.1 hypothetical protein [Bacteroides sp.]
MKERVGNQNRLAAFAKVGKEVSFPNDFATILTDKPVRTPESIGAASTAINLDKDQLMYALFWFISSSPMDDIALNNLRAGNREKAGEIFRKKETCSSLINSGVLAFIDGNTASGFNYISKVMHNSAYRSELLQALGLANLQLSEDDLAELVITEMLKEVPANKLLSACTNASDRAIISKRALEEPISAINSAISVAKNADTKNPESSLAAGTKLMNSTKAQLKAVKDIAGATSPQYQMVADNVAKQVLKCGINYYNNALDSDVESPRKAMVLQSYALSIAVGQITKDKCKENYDILKQAVDNMPPVEVAIETRKVKEELRKFCQLPDKISHSVTLLNNTKPLLQTIKSKLGASNSFYLTLSTQVVGNALHNVIEEVNQAQNYFMAVIKAVKESGIDPSLLNYLGDENSPAKIIDNKVKPVMREAWKATVLMDSFDMESEFKTNRYNPNRKSLIEMCESLKISTHVSTPRPSTPRRTSSANNSTAKEKNSGWSAFWIVTLICAVIGAMANGSEGFFCGGILGAMIVGNIARAIFRED